jgi:ADP-heptose:LPS heptosyltransferase
MTPQLLQNKARILLFLEALFLEIRILISNAIAMILILFFSSLFGKKKLKNKNKNLLCVNTEKLGDLILASEFLYCLGNYGNFNQRYIIIQDLYLSLYDWNKLGFLPITLKKRSYKYNIIYRIKFILQLRQIGLSSIINFTPERGWINEELSIIPSAEEKIILKAKSRYLSPILINFFNKRYTKVKMYSIHNEYEILDSFLKEEGFHSQLNSSVNNIVNMENVNSILKDINGRKYICIAPFSSDKKRTWDIRNYIELVNVYSKKMKIIILGEAEELASIKMFNLNLSNIITYTNKNLGTIISLINHASLFIGNDSGLTHIAHNLKIPTIAIIGGGEYGAFFPYKNHPSTLYFYHKMDCFGCHWNCIYKVRYCLKYVGVDEIVKGINFLLVLNDESQNNENDKGK